MSERGVNRLSWLFVTLLLASGIVIFQDRGAVAFADGHEAVRELRDAGDIVSLSELLDRPELAGQRIIEAELENEHGRYVYELELLDTDGRVHERYYDAVTGKPLRYEAED